SSSQISTRFSLPMPSRADASFSAPLCNPCSESLAKPPPVPTSGPPVHYRWLQNPTRSGLVCAVRRQETRTSPGARVSPPIYGGIHGGGPASGMRELQTERRGPARGAGPKTISRSLAASKWGCRAPSNTSSDGSNLDGLGSLVAGLGLIADLHPLVQRAKAFAIDVALVDEEVPTALVRGDEAEALVGVEPLDGSGWH